MHLEVSKVLVTEKGSCWVLDTMKGESEVECMCWWQRSNLFTALIPTKTCSLVLSEIHSAFQNIPLHPDYYMSVRKLLERTAVKGLLCIFMSQSHLLSHRLRSECVHFIIPPCYNSKLDGVVLDRRFWSCCGLLKTANICHTLEFPRGDICNVSAY